MKLFLSILAIILAVSVQAASQYGTVTVSKVISVYDYDNKSNSGKFFIIESRAINELNYEPTQYRVKV